MKYHLSTSECEWEIEPSENRSWVLKKRKEDRWSEIGKFRSATEAAVTVGASMASNSEPGQRYMSRLRFVLSGWNVIEQN